MTASDWLEAVEKGIAISKSQERLKNAGSRGSTASTSSEINDLRYSVGGTPEFLAGVPGVPQVTNADLSGTPGTPGTLSGFQYQAAETP